MIILIIVNCYYAIYQTIRGRRGARRGRVSLGDPYFGAPSS